tara:strand:- start:128 stop:664 length:537 start_codon:yes stop_codon:yes gene_type:complete
MPNWNHNYSRPIAGLGSVGSYQIAGHPFITGSAGMGENQTAKISFPTVARSVTVIARTTQDGTGDSNFPGLWVHFTKDKAATDVDGGTDETRKDGNYTFEGFHFISLPNKDDAFTFNVKCKEVYITNKSGVDDAKFELFAELTHIPTGSMYELTGSGLTSKSGQQQVGWDQGDEPIDT